MTKLKDTPRGFVIIVVLAAAAAITAVVAGQLVSAQKAQLVGTRASEEVKARGIAEACLALMTAYAQNFDQDAGVGDDFDAILAGPDGTANTNDDYLPFGNTRRVEIPEDAAGLGSPQVQEHRWNLVDIPGSGGVCAVRFDDNSDDGKPALIGAPDPDTDAPGCVGEGGALDVNNCDRDRAIFVTVIGLYPLLAGTIDDEAYEKAHVHVSLRRLVQVPTVVQPQQPALWAGNVEIGNNTDICGLGGITANTADFANGSCACGQILTDPAGLLGNPPTTGGTCNCPPPIPGCIPSQPTTGATPPVPTWVHWGNTGDGSPSNSMMDNEILGLGARVADPLATGPDGEGAVPDPATSNSIAPNGNDTNPADFCAFYGKANKQLFVWDAGDFETRTTLEGANGGVQMHDADGDGVIESNIPQHDCTGGSALATSEFLPQPCTWNQPGGAGTTFTSLTCDANESPCWKLITAPSGTLDDVRLGGAAALGVAEEMLSGGPDFHPVRNVAIPNVKNGRRFGANAASLCGVQNATNCGSCTTTVGGSNADPVVEANGHWDFVNGAQDGLSPTPSVWFMESYGGKVHLKEGGGRFRATVVTNGDMDVEDMRMCCAVCDCTNFSSLGNLHLTDHFGGADSVAVGMVAANNNGQFGTVLKAVGAIDMDESLTVGDIRGDSIDWGSNDGNHLGAQIAYANGADCSNTAPCSPAHICAGNSGVFAGDIHSMSSVDLKNNGVTFGNVVSKDGVCIKNNASLSGNIMAAGTIDLGNNGSIVATASNPLGATLQVTQQITTYFETLW